MVKEACEMSQMEENPMLNQTSPEFLRIMFEHSADAMAFLDGSRLVDCNSAAARLMKRERSQLVGAALDQFFPEQQPDGLPSSQAWADLVRIVHEWGSHLFEWTLRNTEGEDVTVEVSLTAAPGSEQPILFSIWRDITGRKKAEADLLEDLKIHRMLFDSPQVGIAVVQDEIIAMANFGMVVLTGYPLEALQGTYISNLVVPEAQAMVTENHHKRLSGEAALDEYITHVLRRDGETRIPVNIRESVVNYHGKPAVMYTLRNLTDRMREEEMLRAMLARRGHQMEIGNDIAQEMALATTVDELFRRAVTLIKEWLGYYHAQILRYEPARNELVLIRGYGDAGEKMLAQGYRVSLGQGLIGLAAATRQTVMRVDVTGNPDWQPNEMLPDTKGEIALPIKYGDRFIGILDIQSDQAGAMTEDDRFLLESLCSQIAIFQESTHLRQEMQDRLNELNKLYEGTTHEGWAAFRASSGAPAGYLFDRSDVRASEEIWMDEIEAAVKQKSLVAGREENRATVAPLAVRGEVIGALGVLADPQRMLSEDDLSLIEQVSDQVAQALESARLFEQTSVALDEAEKLYNFSRNLAGAADLDGIVGAVVEAVGIPEICRCLLVTFDYNSVGELAGGVVKTSWFSGQGESQGIPVGVRFERGYVEKMLGRFSPTQPMFIKEADAEARKRGIFSLAVLPLWVGNTQVGVLILQADSPHEFTEEEKRPMLSLAQQAAITIQSRLLFDQVTSSEARFRDISMSSADWVWEVDAQGRYTFCSERVEDVMGYTAAEMLGKTPFDFMVPEDAEKIGAIFTDLIMNKAQIVDLENRVRAKDGQERTMLTSGVPVLDEMGNLAG
jgi:PAS domain S-box-containing protein